MALESEEALIESFEDMATFGNTDYTNIGNYRPEMVDPSQQEGFEDSYFMDMQLEDGSGYPTPEVSPPSFSLQDSYSDKWGAPSLDDQLLDDMGDPRDENDWSSSEYDDGGRSPRDEPYQRRGSVGTGASYLDNLSRSDRDSSPGLNRGSSSYLNDLSRQEPPSPGVGGSGEFPERIRAAYRDWCQYYDKPYNEGRLRIFAANFLAVEKYHRETGVSLILNELADMTSEEYQDRKGM
jgi:hypothetical protein